MFQTPILQLAHRHAQWLMARQTAVAQNVAHASSPGYRAVDVKPFERMIARGGIELSMTSVGHLRPTQDENYTTGSKWVKAVEISHSGNTVSLDQQLVTANEVRQGYMLNAGILKSVNRLLAAAIKG